MSTVAEDIQALQEQEPLIEFRELRNPHFTLLIWQNLCGQFCIQLTDKRLGDPGAPEGHGGIVQVLDTYRVPVLMDAVMALREDADPLALADIWRRNCGGLGDRIRLDNTQSSAEVHASGETR